MKLKSRQLNADSTLKRWVKRHPYDYAKVRNDPIAENLKSAAADGPLTPERVDSIMGNSAWTDVQCNECGVSVEEAVLIGEPPDHESSTATVCADCLEKALSLIKRHAGKADTGDPPTQL